MMSTETLAALCVIAVACLLTSALTRSAVVFIVAVALAMAALAAVFVVGAGV